MKVVYSSVKLVPFLVAIAFGSSNVGNSYGAAEQNTEDAKSMRQKREVVETRYVESEATGGAIYIRWGRTTCVAGSDAVYKGVAGGSFYDSTGGGSNYLCLPLNPVYGAYNERVAKHSKLYGSEYHFPTGFSLNNNNYRPLHDNNVPCVLCRSQTKSSVAMIPGRNQCFSGWKIEYNGFLMSESSVHKGRTEFVCMDGQPESDHYGFRDENGALFYNVEGICGSLPCPPYVPNREITCAVCTK